MGEVDQRHLDWLARSFGRGDYRPIDRKDIDAIRRMGETRTWAPGTHLHQEGEKDAAVIIVEEGEVEVYRGTGSRRRVLARSGPGSVLGDMPMFGDTEHVSSVRAVRAVRGLRFERSRLLPELAVHPGILLRWLVAMVRRMEQTQRRLVRLMHKSVIAQVSDLLREESEHRPEVNLSQATIGMLLGVSRQSVNEALGRLRNMGVVETGYRTITILNPDRLATISRTGRP